MTDKARAKPTYRDSRLHSFIRKHFKVIAIAGSVIVSTTLTLKDWTQSEAKEFVSAAQNQEMFFRMQSLGGVTNERLDQLSRNVEQLAIQIDPIRKLYGKADLTVLQAAFFRQDDNISLSITNAETLIALLPSGEAVRFRLELQKVADELKELDKRAAPLLVVGPLVVGTPADAEVAQSTLLDHLRESDYLKHRVGEISRDVLSGIKKREDRSERLSALFGFTSYGVIAVGLALSLTGQLVGKPEDIPDVKL